MAWSSDWIMEIIKVLCRYSILCAWLTFIVIPWLSLGVGFLSWTKTHKSTCGQSLLQYCGWVGGRAAAGPPRHFCDPCDGIGLGHVSSPTHHRDTNWFCHSTQRPWRSSQELLHHSRVTAETKSAWRAAEMLPVGGEPRPRLPCQQQTVARVCGPCLKHCCHHRRARAPFFPNVYFLLLSLLFNDPTFLCGRELGPTV